MNGTLSVGKRLYIHVDKPHSCVIYTSSQAVQPSQLDTHPMLLRCSLFCHDMSTQQSYALTFKFLLEHHCIIMTNYFTHLDLGTRQVHPRLERNTRTTILHRTFVLMHTNCFDHFSFKETQCFNVFHYVEKF